MRCLVKIWLLLLPVVLATSCKSGRNATGEPAPWLQEKLATLNERYSEITLYEYNGERYYAVFVKGAEKSYDMNRTTIYDAMGETYLSLGGLRKKSEKEVAFFRNAVNKGVIWQSDIAKEKARESTVKKKEFRAE